MTSEIIELAKIAFNSDSPAVSIVIVMVIAFLLFVTGKRFFDTEFIKTSKEARETQHQLNEELRIEIDRLKRKIEELEVINQELKKQIREPKEGQI